MEEFHQILGYVAIGLVGVVVFFLKGLHSKFMESQEKITELKEANQDLKGKNELINKEIEIIDRAQEEFKEYVYKKFTTVNANRESQNALNTQFKEIFAKINANLESLMKNR